MAIEAVVLEPFHVPTGSMAPALYGRHRRRGTCPCCGQETIVGRAAGDSEGSGAARFYRKAFCQNCGPWPVPSPTRKSPATGFSSTGPPSIADPPARWEIVVFRLLGLYYIKRVLGLAGEEILIHDGDVYVDGEMLRKSFPQAKQIRRGRFSISSTRPRSAGNIRPGREGTPVAIRGGSVVEIDGLQSPCTASYRNYSAATKKCEPIRDEYAYNGGLHADSECVHDFLIETEIEVAGSGSVSLRLCDGGDWVEVLLPLGEARPIEAFAWPIDEPNKVRKFADSERALALRPGKRQRLELALRRSPAEPVDRRQAMADADLPALKQRAGVERLQLHADGDRVSLHGFRLFRDVHYGQHGTNGVRGKAVRLAEKQLFLLGDNSPNSEDSRFWPDEGARRFRQPGRSVLLSRGSAGERPGLRWLP